MTELTLEMLDNAVKLLQDNATNNSRLPFILTENQKKIADEYNVDLDNFSRSCGFNGWKVVGKL